MLGIAGSISVVVISWLRRSAYIDADHTGFVTIERRSAIRTAMALLALTLMAGVLGLLLAIGGVVAFGVLPALAAAVMALLLVACSVLAFGAAAMRGYRHGRGPRGRRGSLASRLGVQPNRVWEVTTLAQKPGTTTRAALLMAGQLIRDRVDAGDLVVIQARTPELRRRYQRLGFRAGPGDHLVIGGMDTASPPRPLDATR